MLRVGHCVCLLGLGGHCVIPAIAGQTTRLSLPIVLTLTGLGLTVLGLTITLIIVGPLTGAA